MLILRTDKLLPRRAFRHGLLSFVALLMVTGHGLADELADWTHIAVQATLTAPITPAPVATRNVAIVEAAVFDAVDGIDRRYAPIFVQALGPRHASENAAAVQAAYAILIRLYPAQLNTFDQLRSASLTAISGGRKSESFDDIHRGIAWGQAVADVIWSWRSKDGLAVTLPPFLGGTDPGEWQPTPPGFAPGAVPQLAHTTPWVLQSPSQFRPPAPPALDSAEYATDFNETKLMGRDTSTARTAEETAYAKFWAPGNPPDYWNPVALSLAAERHYSLAKTARLLAHVNLAMADSLIGCWDAKYTYVAWRPVTAIQLADIDGNDNTATDPSWMPLVTTPAHPEYPSAHSCASGAAVKVLTHYFGDTSPITISTDTLPDQSRSYPNLSTALDEVINARVLGGIHFRHSCETGQALGQSVGEYVLAHSLQRLQLREPRDGDGRDEDEN